MIKKSQALELSEAIIELKIKQALQGKLLKDDFHSTYENLKPANLIRSTFKDITSAPNFKGNLINVAMSLAAGFISKKVVAGNTKNPIKQILGTILQLVVTGVVSKNADEIKEVSSKAIDAVFHHKNTNEVKHDSNYK